MKVIGLAGKAGAGKDYVYETIDAALASHKAIRRMAFADGVKMDIEEALNDGRSMMPLWEKPYTHEIRSLLQWWGTEFRRGESVTYWVDFGLNSLRELAEIGTDVTCVTDVRFQNEVDAIQSVGGIVFEVFAPPNVRADRLNITETEQEEMSKHATEQGGLLNVDGLIDNSRFPVWPQNLNDYLLLPAGYQPGQGDIRPEWAKS